MVRCDEEGWTEICNHDSSGRRGLWIRVTPRDAFNENGFQTEPITRLELCAGREGDDWYVSLKGGDATGCQCLTDLVSCLWYASPENMS